MSAIAAHGQPARTATLILVCLIIVFARPASAQEWTTGAPPGDDRKDVICWIANEDGHVLLMRTKEENNRHWILAELRLGRDLKFGSVVPGYRVDDDKQIDLDWQIGHGERHDETWAEVGGSTAYWTMWSFFEEEITQGMMISSWFDGEEVKILFELSDGSTGTTSFPLAGLKEIVPEVTGYRIVEDED
jgi:hypothetical protein